MTKTEKSNFVHKILQHPEINMENCDGVDYIVVGNRCMKFKDALDKHALELYDWFQLNKLKF